MPQRIDARGDTSQCNVLGGVGGASVALAGDGNDVRFRALVTGEGKELWIEVEDDRFGGSAERWLYEFRDTQRFGPDQELRWTPADR